MGRTLAGTAEHHLRNDDADDAKHAVLSLLRPVAPPVRQVSQARGRGSRASLHDGLAVVKSIR